MQYPTYDPSSPVTPLTTEEIAALDTLLQRLDADTAMSLDGFDGYITAFAIGPQAMRDMPSADWLPLIWGGDPAGTDEAEPSVAPSVAPFATKRQRKSTVVLALRHLRHLSVLLHDNADDWEPIFSIAEQGATEYADAREWCMGFLQAVDLMPDAWGTVWADSAIAPLLTLGGGLDGLPSASADLDNPTVCDQLSRAVPDAVLGLTQRIVLTS